MIEERKNGMGPGGASSPAANAENHSMHSGHHNFAVNNANGGMFSGSGSNGGGISNAQSSSMASGGHTASMLQSS